MSKFLSLKDVGSFDKFLQDFRHLSNKIPTDRMSDMNRLDCFLRGLRPKTRHELFLKKASSLEEAILIANTIESAKNQGSDPERSNFVKFTNKKNFSSFKNKSISGTYKPSERTDGNKDKACFKCGIKGHLQATCRVKTQNYASGNKSSFKPKQQGKPVFNKQNITCHKCSKKGHYANECGGSRHAAKVNFVQLANVHDIVQCNMIRHVANDNVTLASTDVSKARLFKEIALGTSDERLSRMAALCMINEINNECDKVRAVRGCIEPCDNIRCIARRGKSDKWLCSESQDNSKRDDDSPQGSNYHPVCMAGFPDVQVDKSCTIVEVDRVNKLVTVNATIRFWDDDDLELVFK